MTKNGESDDANGCNLEGNSAWLKVCRVDNTFSFHYSVDGEQFYMMRFFSLPAGKQVKVGLLAQAPVGNGGARIYDDLTLEMSFLTESDLSFASIALVQTLLPFHLEDIVHPLNVYPSLVGFAGT